MKCTFEWGGVIATLLSILSIVPRHCARLIHFLHPKLREINAVLSTPQLMTLTLRRAGHSSMGESAGSRHLRSDVLCKGLATSGARCGITRGRGGGCPLQWGTGARRTQPSPVHAGPSPPCLNGMRTGPAGGGGGQHGLVAHSVPGVGPQNVGACGDRCDPQPSSAPCHKARPRSFGRALPVSGHCH